MSSTPKPKAKPRSRTQYVNTTSNSKRGAIQDTKKK